MRILGNIIAATFFIFIIVSTSVEARDGYGSFYERGTGTKYTVILENDGKNGYFFKQTKEDLDRIKNNRTNNSFQDLINNQRSKTKKPSVAPKKSPTTSKPVTSFEEALFGKGRGLKR